MSPLNGFKTERESQTTLASFRPIPTGSCNRQKQIVLGMSKRPVKSNASAIQKAIQHPALINENRSSFLFLPRLDIIDRGSFPTCFFRKLPFSMAKLFGYSFAIRPLSQMACLSSALFRCFEIGQKQKCFATIEIVKNIYTRLILPADTASDLHPTAFCREIIFRTKVGCPPNC